MVMLGMGVVHVGLCRSTVFGVVVTGTYDMVVTGMVW